MAQKLLAARARSRAGEGWLEIAVDQVALARDPRRVLALAAAQGLKKSAVELAVAYDGHCVRLAGDAQGAFPAPELLAHGVQVARPGTGFPGPVHLERFASPGRVCVTDEPRLAGVGGAGMLTLVVPPASLARALVRGAVLVREPVTVQVSLTGRLRPFVCARDVAFELLRRGVGEVVQRVEERRGAPVVLEIGGPSARGLSVGERSVLAGVAPQLGASAALFVADERTEVYLRDQRRSKAHRALSPDAGATIEEVVGVDLGAVDPLVLDDEGRVRAARDLAGEPVSQALLGGDGGATLRDLLAAAALLKSKRVPARLDFLVALPSRQMLEVLAGSGALGDLIATGARLVEPDARVVRGEMYPPHGKGVALRTFDAEPRTSPQRGAFVASAETVAYAVATGAIGDPRAFKRPVRVTVPRALPTDDVLVARKAERGGVARSTSASPGVEAPVPWTASVTLELVAGRALGDHLALAQARPERAAAAVVCASLEELRDLSSRAPSLARSVRAVLATYIPGSLVTLLSAAGIAALRLDAPAARKLAGEKTLALPAPARWVAGETTAVTAGAAKIGVTWLAAGTERAWATGAVDAGA